MPISILSIPDHIRIAAIQKMNLDDFANFKLSSLQSLKDSENVKTRLSLDSLHPNNDTPFNSVNSIRACRLSYSNKILAIDEFRSYWKDSNRKNLLDLPIRFENCDVEIYEILTEDFCIALTAFLELTNSSIRSLYVSEIDCSPDALKRLIETKKIKEMRLDELIDSEYLEIEAVRNITNLVTSFLPQGAMLSLNLLKFTIYSSNMNNSGMSQLLKELDDGRRKINYCSIHTYHRLQKDVALEGITISSGCPSESGETVYFGCATKYKLEIGDYHDINCRTTVTITKIEENRCLKRKASESLTASVNYKKTNNKQGCCGRQIFP